MYGYQQPQTMQEMPPSSWLTLEEDLFQNLDMGVDLNGFVNNGHLSQQQQQQQQQQHQQHVKAEDDEEDEEPEVAHEAEIGRGFLPDDTKLTHEQVYRLLVEGEKGRYNPFLPQRPQASPISLSATSFYVKADMKHKLSESEKDEILGNPEELIAVKYQGFTNGEIWWSHDNLSGLVARNLTRKRTKPTSPAGSQFEDRSLAGRWYSLIRRDGIHVDVTKANCRSFVVRGAPSFVQFWETETRTSSFRKKRKRAPAAPVRQASSNDHYSISSHDTLETYDSPSSPASENQMQVVNGDMQIDGTLTVNGSLIARNIKVLGDLTVEGNIKGKLVTGPGQADYAEWFGKLHMHERIEPGDVVQLRSPSQKLTKETIPGMGPLMVVSTSPSVAAGLPPDAKPGEGAFCAFIGQVPVKVQGPVLCGDQLMPSGSGDGLAVRANSIRHINQDFEPIATAMVSCPEGVHIVNTFVRWPHTQEWSAKKEATNELYTASSYSWKWCFVFLLYLGLRLTCIAKEGSEKLFNTLELCHLVFVLCHFPVFPEFARRDFWIGTTLYMVDLVFCLYKLISENLLLSSDHAVENGNGEESVVVSMRQLKTILFDLFFAQVHVVACVFVLVMYLRVRKAILAVMAEKRTTRMDWKEKMTGLSVLLH